MLNQLLGLVQGQLGNSLSGHPALQNVPGNNKEEVVGQTILETIQDKAQGQGSSFSMADLDGDNVTPSSSGVQKLLPDVVTKLTSRLGISPEAAQSIATAAIPIVLSTLGKAKSGGAGGMDIGGMLGGLLGGKDKSASTGKSSGGLGDMLGGFLK